MNWIKFKIKENANEKMDCIWDGELPKNGEEVLISDGRFIGTDIWTFDENAGLENYDNYHQQFLWWAHLPQAPTKNDHSGWKKIKTRPLTQEEQDLGLGYEFMYDCDLPDVGEDVLNSNGKWVSKDRWEYFEDGTVGFYFADDEDIADLWWMPMPSLPRKDRE